MVGYIVEYQTTEVAAAIARLPQTVLLREAKSETVWRWERKGRSIEISVDSDNPPGSPLKTPTHKKGTSP
jgi:hypothetical protein